MGSELADAEIVVRFGLGLAEAEFFVKNQDDLVLARRHGDAFALGDVSERSITGCDMQLTKSEVTMLKS